MDVRRLGVILPLFEAHGFVQIHREYAVNSVREIRRRPQGRDWEVKLRPPVNRILPVGRQFLPALWEALGEAPA